jgi:hypothetical protein
MLRVNKTILNFKFSFQKPLFCSRFSYFPAVGLIKGRCLAIIEAIFKFKILEAAWPWGIEGGKGAMNTPAHFVFQKPSIDSRFLNYLYS